MKNFKSRVVAICCVFAFLFAMACTAENTANPSSTTYKTVNSMSVEVANTDSLTISKISVESSQSSSSAVKDETPCAIDLLDFTPNQLIAKYGKHTLKQGGWEGALGTLTFDSLPNFLIFTQGVDDKALSQKIMAIGFELNDTTKNLNITNLIKLGMTRKQIENVYGKKIELYEDSDTDAKYCFNISVAGCSISGNFDSDKETAIYSGGEIIALSEDDVSIPSQAETPVSSQKPSTQYVINDYSKMFASQHAASSDKWERANADAYGKIDAMYTLGLIYDEGYGVWVVRSEKNFLENSPDMSEDYYYALLKHFNVKSGDLFDMNEKFSLANPSGRTN